MDCASAMASRSLSKAVRRPSAESFDKDLDAIAEAQSIADPRFSIRHQGFMHLDQMPAASVAGVLLDTLGISPIQALLYTAILYGLTAPVMIAMVLHLANNKRVMGAYTNSWLSNVLIGLTLLLMSAAAIALLYFQFFS